MSKTGEGAVSLTADFLHHFQLCFFFFLISFLFFPPWSPVFPWPMVRWLLGSDRKNEIVNTSGREFMASVCVTVLRDLVIQKDLGVTAAPLVSAEAAKVVHAARALDQGGKSRVKNILVLKIKHNPL